MKHNYLSMVTNGAILSTIGVGRYWKTTWGNGLVIPNILRVKGISAADPGLLLR